MTMQREGSGPTRARAKGAPAMTKKTPARKPRAKAKAAPRTRPSVKKVPAKAAPRARRSLKKVPVQVARAEFETFFDEAAKRVEDFGERIEALVTRVEVGTQARFVELEETWRQTQQWLLAQVDNLKQQEQKAEQLLDTARVKVELGKMDVSDMGENLRKRVEPVREAIDGLVARGSSEAADGLKRLSHAFMDLRKELLKKARHSSTLYQ